MSLLHTLPYGVYGLKMEWPRTYSTYAIIHGKRKYAEENNDVVPLPSPPLPLKPLPRYKSEKAMYTKVYQTEQEQDWKKNYVQTIKFGNPY